MVEEREIGDAIKRAGDSWSPGKARYVSCIVQVVKAI